MSARFISAEEINQSFSFRLAVEAIQGALRSGFNPAADLPRSILPIDKGELLVMPSSSKEGSGIKVLTIAPDNPAQNQPRIQGLYLLFDHESLAVSSILDGAALTTFRTPAVSFAAIKDFLPTENSNFSVVIFGSGPQAISHLQTFTEIAPEKLCISKVTFVARDLAKATNRIPNLQKLGLNPDCEVQVLSPETDEISNQLRSADLVIAATTARKPLFDSSLLKPSVIVIAVGSHEPDVREIDSAFLSRAQVIVETRASALREAGDVIMAIKDGVMTADSLLELADVVCGRAKINQEKPILFKSSGMSWEDLVTARAIERTFK